MKHFSLTLTCVFACILVLLIYVILSEDFAQERRKDRISDTSICRQVYEDLTDGIEWKESLSNWEIVQVKNALDQMAKKKYSIIWHSTQKKIKSRILLFVKSDKYTSKIMLFDRKHQRGLIVPYGELMHTIEKEEFNSILKKNIMTIYCGIDIVK